MPNDSDIVVWITGVWCFGSEFEEYIYNGRDYTIIKEGTVEYEDFLKENE